MPDDILDNDDLSTTQEYVIAGIVILLFGLLCLFLNNTQTPAVDTANSVDIPLIPPSTAKPIATTPSIPSGATTKKQTTIADSTSTSTKATDNNKADTPPVKSSPIQAKPNATTTEERHLPKSAESVEQDKLTAPSEQSASEAESNPVPSENIVKKEANDTPQQSSYQLPDGSKVEIANGGFETALRQAIQDNQLNQAITFDNIYFHTGSARIRGDSEHQVKVTAALLHKYQNIKILLRGHTDNTGTHEQNALLSLDRANAMGVALVSLGIDKKRIQIQGKGDSAPIASNDTEEGRKQNRRLELLITQGTSD